VIDEASHQGGRAPTRQAGDPTSIELSGAEAVALAEVVSAYGRVMPPDRRQACESLLTAVESGSVGGTDIALLEQVCTLALETGQARRLGLAETETLLAGVYRRSPAGQARSAEVKDVNEALSHLTDKVLTRVLFAASRPGRYTFTLAVEGVEITLAITAEGLEITSLSTG
jgi:hypothetical protein